MNIVEAYIKMKGQLIIIISGLSGTGKTKLAKNISELFKMDLINLNFYCKKEYNVKTKLIDGTEIINWDSDDIYDWNVFNENVKKYSSTGVIIVGSFFPKNKLSFNSDFHVQIKLSKQNLLKRRLDYIEDYGDDCRKKGKNIDQNIENAIFNQFTYPYYLDTTERSDITKFLNANEYINMDKEKYDEKLYDELYEYLINKIDKYVYKKN